MTWLLDDRPLERALVTRLRYLGDVVMSTVVLAALRRGDPALDVGYLCEAAYSPVLDGQVDLGRVHALATDRRGVDARARAAGGAPVAAAGRPTAALVGELRAQHYDVAIDLFFNPRSAWLLRLSGIGRRLAGPAGSRGWLYTHQSAAGAARRHVGWDRLAPGGLGDHLSRLSPLVHAESGCGFVEWFLAQERRALPRLGPRPGGRASAEAVLAKARLPIEPSYLVLAPGATWPTKRWPTAHWGALVSSLLEAWPGSIVVLTPPGADGTPAYSGPERPGRVAVLPPLALPAVLDLLAGAAALVSVDGGVMHAAVGLGTPTLALFGPTDPGLWFPYEGGGPFRVLATRPACHPCDRHECDAFVCLPDLRPAMVSGELLALLAGAAATRGREST